MSEIPGDDAVWIPPRVIENAKDTKPRQVTRRCRGCGAPELIKEGFGLHMQKIYVDKKHLCPPMLDELVLAQEFATLKPDGMTFEAYVREEQSMRGA